MAATVAPLAPEEENLNSVVHIDAESPLHCERVSVYPDRVAVPIKNAFFQPVIICMNLMSSMV